MKAVRHSLLRRAYGFVAVLALLAAVPHVVMAAGYVGSGDTGWTHDNKSECCDDAVYLAQNDSAGLCEIAGRRPRFSSSSRRGLCDWDASGDAGEVVYRCTATATVYCR